MSELNPTTKVVDYKVAKGEEAINELLAKGYDLHGEPKFINEYTVEDGIQQEGTVTYQVMVKRESITIGEYIELLRPIIFLGEKMSRIAAKDLYTDADIEELLAELEERGIPTE